MQRCLAMWCVLLGFSFASTAANAQGISARNLGESLAGLNGVHVIVESLSDAGTAAGLNASTIKSSVEERLRARGVPVLGLGALAMDPRGPSLLVKVDLDFSDPVYFYHAQVQFFQNVSLMTGNDVLTSMASASTWQAFAFDRIGKFRIASLPQEVNRLVDQFAEDYLEHNAADMPESDENAGEETESEEADSLLGSGSR